MKNDEFVASKCKKCKYKYNDRDICEIRANINGEPNCINYQECSLFEKVKRYIKKLIKSEFGTKILK